MVKERKLKADASKISLAIDRYRRYQIANINKEINGLVRDRNNLMRKLLVIPVVGLTNETEDGYYVPFIDYDNTTLAVIDSDLLHLHRVFGYCFFAIFESSFSNPKVIENDKETFTIANYHVIGLDKIPYYTHREMLKHTRCDGRFRFPPYSAKNWVLRQSIKGQKPEPKLIKVLNFNNGHNCSYQHNLAMLLWLKKNYGIDIEIEKMGNFDKSVEPEMIEYLTTR